MTDRSQGTPRHAEPRRTQQERLLETRALSLELARAALPRGHDRPADGRCQPHQVAPGPRHLVLRDLHPRQAPARLPDVRSRLQLLLQLLLREPGPAAAAPQARRAHAAVVPSACWPIAPMSTTALAKLLARGVAPELRDHAPDRGRHQPRAAASGAAAHRHPGAVCRQSAAAGLSRRAAAAGDAGRARGASLDRRSPAASARSATTATASAWDNEGPRHDVLIHPVPPGRPPGHQRRMARFHGRRRLSHGRAVALRRLGHGQPRGLAGAALLGGARRRSGSPCRSKACSRSTARAPSPMSATSRPTPSRAGPASACRPSSSGRSPRRACP